MRVVVVDAGAPGWIVDADAGLARAGNRDDDGDAVDDVFVGGVESGVVSRGVDQMALPAGGDVVGIISLGIWLKAAMKTSIAFLGPSSKWLVSSASCWANFCNEMRLCAE